jgi:hypothetical protein
VLFVNSLFHAERWRDHTEEYTMDLLVLVLAGLIGLSFTRRHWTNLAPEYDDLEIARRGALNDCVCPAYVEQRVEQAETVEHPHIEGCRDALRRPALAH